MRARKGAQGFILIRQKGKMPQVRVNKPVKQIFRAAACHVRRIFQYARNELCIEHVQLIIVKGLLVPIEVEADYPIARRSDFRNIGG